MRSLASDNSDDIQNIQGTSNSARSHRTSRMILSVSVDEVESKPQVRQEFRNIDSLADSLLTEGQQTPIIVSPRNDQGKYVIQKGERRWRACKHAGIAEIDIIVNDKAQSLLDETAGELIENIQRDNLTALEIAKALQRFVDDDWKQVDIAKRLGKSTKFVSSHLGLLRLPECVKEIYDKGLCADTDTLNILRQLHELSPAKCIELCAEAASRGIYRQRARDVLNETYIQIDKEEHESPYTGWASRRRDNSSGHQDPSFTDADYWNPVTPDALIFVVSVTRGRYNKVRGILLTDRVAPDGGRVWLKAQGKHADEGIICVNVADLNIISLTDCQPDYQPDRQPDCLPE
ncbi:MAG: ParB/RepB/Spo0J family partition protein [Pseudohongiella sp.]|uniref:ParB/RepB/Spo0J family partition protein n=1 Tax=Pseudohongiella sp. TaxID=1979412 RepID=UPI0034A09150